MIVRYHGQQRKTAKEKVFPIVESAPKNTLLDYHYHSVIPAYGVINQY